MSSARILAPPRPLTTVVRDCSPAANHKGRRAVEGDRCRAYSGRMSKTSGADSSGGPVEALEDCPHCSKPKPLCICEGLTPLDNRIEVLILQHPQEQDRALGTARLTLMQLTRGVLKVGLSWPSLSKALGRPVADPSRWAVLYLGSAKAANLDSVSGVVAISREGEVEENQSATLRRLEGIVLLDGSWSQSKALWWRNPWMLKCQRVILRPSRPSRYGRLRREPRREGLSTIEATAMLLSGLEDRAEIAEILNASFVRMLKRYQEVHREQPALATKPRPKRGFRRRRRP